MTDSPRKFPLFNRGVVLLLSGAMLVGLLTKLASAKFRKDLDFVNGFLIGVFLMLSCLGIWLALRFRNQSQEELEEEQDLPSAERPEVPDDALVYRFSAAPKGGAVFVDSENGWIHFQDCHVPRRFIASAQPWYSCSIADLIGVHTFRYRGESLTIVTPDGRALIPDSGTQYGELRKALDELVPFTRPGFSTDHPLMGMVYLAGALLGMFAGVMLTPRNAPNSTLGVFFIVGAFLGVAALHGLVWLSDRFKIGLVQPLGYATLGMCVGLAVNSALVSLRGWGGDVLIALVAIGGVAGLGYGVRRQRLERPPK